MNDQKSLVETLYGYAIGLARRYSGGGVDADDLLQEVLLVFLENEMGWRVLDPDNMVRLAMVSARNRVIDICRAYRRRGKREAPIEEGESIIGLDVEKQVALRLAVERLFTGIPPAHYAILNSLLQGVRPHEVGRAKSTVYRVIQNAREQLQEAVLN